MVIYNMKKKTFDCIEMKRKAALQIHEKLKGMSREEKAAYWQKRHREIQQEFEKWKKNGKKYLIRSYGFPMMMRYLCS